LEIVKQLKEKLFDDLRHADIEDAYLDVMRALLLPEQWPEVP
jgi:hypothetical protein